MKIKEWFDNGCDYDQGVVMYSKLPKANRNLLRHFVKKQSTWNENKLKYELQKHLDSESDQDLNQDPIVETTENNENNPNTDGVSEVIMVPVQSLEPLPPQSKYHRTLLINQLPVELHELYISQKNDFARACSLKIQLNSLQPSEESKALEMCIEIESLFDRIEKAWKVFDHYLEHNSIIDLSPKGYEDLSAAELIKAESNKMSSISKLKKRIIGYQENLKKLENKTQKEKCRRALEKSSRGLIQHEIDLEQIRKFISNNE